MPKKLHAKPMEIHKHQKNRNCQWDQQAIIPVILNGWEKWNSRWWQYLRENSCIEENYEWGSSWYNQYQSPVNRTGAQLERASSRRVQRKGHWIWAHNCFFLSSSSSKPCLSPILGKLVHNQALFWLGICTWVKPIAAMSNLISLGWSLLLR